MPRSPKFLFVHGTGVREPSYSDSIARFRTRALQLFANAEVEPCFWGEHHGARLNAHGASVPEYDTTRSLDDSVDSEAMLIALWELLYRDPLIECRLLRLSTAHEAPMFVQQDERPLLRRLAQGLETPEAAPVAEAIADTDAMAQISEACRWLAEHEEFRELAYAAEEESDYSDTAARALVAKAFQLCEERGVPFLGASDAEWRNRVVDALTVYLAGDQRSFTGAFIDTVTLPLQGLALYATSWRGGNRRGQLTDTASPAGGDILLYQARGKPIRDFIRQRIRETGANIIAAHSLGGVACVDLLIEAHEPSIEMLVTVGSQAPYFYEIDALQSLRFDASTDPDKRLPPTFPSWLNFYDTWDFLSYTGNSLFGSRVRDIAVSSRQPFPQSHSAYWSNGRVWESIARELTPHG